MAAKALHVGVIRGGKFIDDRWFLPGGGDITVGEGEKNSVAVPFASLPRSHTLFVRKGKSCALAWTSAMQVKLERGGAPVPVPGSGPLPLSEDTRGRVSIGEVTFVFNFATPPPVAPRPALPREVRGTLWNVTDHTFASVLLVSLLLHGAAVGSISRRDLPPEEAAMEEIPDRFARLLVPDKPPEVEKPPEEQKPVEEEKAREEERKVDEKKAPARDSAEHKAAVQKAVAQKGLVKILGSVGTGGSGGALANVLSAGGGFSDDIGAALAGAGGVAIATEGGGAPARKGEGAAQATSIGGIGTSGAGAVRMREKGEVAVRGSVSQEGDAEIDSPSVDKAALSRFINLRKGSIQGCYEAQLKRSPSLHGKLVLRFTIGTRGQIVEVGIDSDTLGSDELASCITRLVKAWRMPFSPEADTTVTFPFLFHPG